MLAYISGSVNKELLRRIEYLIEENRVLRNQLKKRIRLTDPERRVLAEKAVVLGKLTCPDQLRLSPLGCPEHVSCERRYSLSEVIHGRRGERATRDTVG